MPNYLEIIENIYSKYTPISKPKPANNNAVFSRERDISDALKYLNLIDADIYDNWLKVAFSLKDKFGDDGFCLYHSWSMKSPKYQSEAECRKKWDSAKGKENNIKFGTLKFLADASNKTPFLNIADWNASKFKGEAPQTEWLVNGFFPKGMPILLAGYGGIGKSYLTLALAVAVANFSNEGNFKTNAFLCNKIVKGGSVVYFSAEDNSAEIHKRLLEIDPEGKIQNNPDKLRIIPLSDAGGAFAIIRKNSQGFLETTEEFENLLVQLKQIDDLAMVIFDPLQVFAQAEIDRDNNSAQFFCNQMRLLASETGATIIINHHMRKPDQQNPIKNLEMAREAVRGASGLVDGVRGVLCLWEYKNEVFAGMAKSNFGAKKEIYKLTRLPSGILISDEDSLHKESVLVLEIIKKCSATNPLTSSGIKSLFSRRKEFGEQIFSWQRKKCEEIIENLIKTKKVEKLKNGNLVPVPAFPNRNEIRE